jgi:uncharacterized repeat protein (TIGR01451 family)
MKKGRSMSIKKLSSHRCVALSLLLLAAFNAQAQTAKPCIELNGDQHMEQEYTDAQGKKATRLVALGKVVPGNEVIYTITAKNICDKPATAVAINDDVPEHMIYVMNSAMGVGTEISYSLDGKSFARPNALSIKNADGTSRAPQAEDIKSIRWLYSTAINPGQTGFVRFRATVK